MLGVAKRHHEILTFRRYALGLGFTWERQPPSRIHPSYKLSHPDPAFPFRANIYFGETFEYVPCTWRVYWRRDWKDAKRRPGPDPVCFDGSNNSAGEEVITQLTAFIILGEPYDSSEDQQGVDDYA